MSKSNKTDMFCPEVHERAVRLVQKNRNDYPSLRVAVESIAPVRLCSPTHG